MQAFVAENRQVCRHAADTKPVHKAACRTDKTVVRKSALEKYFSDFSMKRKESRLALLFS